MAAVTKASPRANHVGTRGYQFGHIGHVVTAIPPVVCGVGDYGSRLNEKLGQSYGFTPHLCVPEPNQSSEGRIASLTSAIQSAEAIILQYSCYGYQRYGAPYWLLRTLSRWKASAFGRRLVTIFHELYATGKPWSTAFWTNPPQRYVTRELAQMSDGALTTTLGQAEILQSWNSGMEIAVLPVPSNVGELQAGQIAVQREPMLVAFGQSGTRRRLYLGNLDGWNRIREAMPDAVIHDIGPPTGLPITELTGLRCISHGQMSTNGISSLLQGAEYGVLDYSDSTLDKSGVFASYCAHGVVPIVFCHSTPQSSTLREGEHFLTPFCHESSSAELSIISQNVHCWYSGHDMTEHARTIHRLLALKTLR